MRELERRVLLTVLDRKWREHLYEMDYLREGIGLRAMAQRDPLVEYQREGGDMFNAMMEAFMEEVVGFVFHLEVEVAGRPQVGLVTDADGAPVTVSAGRNGHDRPLVEPWSSGPDPDGPGVAVHVLDDDGRRGGARGDRLRAARAGPAAGAGQGPGWPAQPGAQLLRARRGRVGEDRRPAGRPRPTTRTPGSAATHRVRAARGRSSRCVTAGPAPSEAARSRLDPQNSRSS